ncbi:MAG: hypothetical protein R3B99_02940 [Polyangiales bacterium]
MTPLPLPPARAVQDLDRMSDVRRHRQPRAARVGLRRSLDRRDPLGRLRAPALRDGCGDHRPLCDGELVPVAPSTKKLVELTHRITSGFC